jgi:hypothetical protein
VQLSRIGLAYANTVDADADQDPAYHFNADTDPDPAYYFDAYANLVPALIMRIRIRILTSK